MKKYVFAIDGHEDEYFRVFDVQKMFHEPVYREDVRAAIAAVKKEIHMREQVFKNDSIRRRQKVAEMEHVLRILSRCSDRFPEVQREMFSITEEYHE